MIDEYLEMEIEDTTDEIELEVENDGGLVGGKDGKSAYQGAVEAGYTGTEKEFYEKLAVDPDWVATSEKSGGDTVVIPRQYMSGGVWHDLKVKPQAGVEYDVYINDKVYVCVAGAKGSSIYIGNPTLIWSTSTEPHNNEPFALLWYGGSATSGMFFNTDTISYPFYLEVKDHEHVEYNKLPEGFLPDVVVKSVNGVKPEANGNVEVKVGVDSDELTAAVESALAEAKASGEFDGADGESIGIADYKTDDDFTTVAFTNGDVIQIPSGVGIKNIRLSKKSDTGNTYEIELTNGQSYDFVAPAGPAGKTGADGTSVTVSKTSESTEDGGNNSVLFSDGTELNVKNGSAGKSAYAYAKDGGYSGTEEDFAKKLANGEGNNYVTAYGAVGDGSTDDTVAFQTALAENRVVFVPEGTYKLSDTLTIGANCCLELSQSTVLKFTQTDKNCISMLRLASLKGNHATIFVPYTFSANVINCDTADDEAALDASNLANSNNVAVPPFTRWDPQWKMSRYVTDINICKPDSRGFHYSKNGDCYGTAVYLHCNIEDYVSFMWGVTMSGVRIAGGFNYGIRIYNIGDYMSSWNHDIRIEAVIDACKIGVSVENCRYARLAVTIQPRRAYSDSNVYKAYAEHGIELIDSRGIDLSSSRVWDWNDTNTLWTAGGKYQHLSLVGECMGLILDDWLYYAQSSYGLRDLIYTDTESNFDKMTILQEPVTRYFKPIDDVPYFESGIFKRKLITDADMDSYFEADVIKGFTDVLSSAVDTDGSVYNGIGYKVGRMAEVNGTETDSGYYVLTGFIPCSKGDAIYASGMSFAAGDNNCRIRFYDKDFNPIYYTAADGKDYALLLNRDALLTGGSSYLGTFEATDDGFKIVVGTGAPHNTTAYARLTIYKSQWGNHPMVAVNEEIKYTVDGFLADGINVKGESVVLTSPSGYAFKITVGDDGLLSAEKIE